MLDEINSEEVPVDLKVPDSFDEFIWDMKNNDYDLRSFAFRLKATVSFFPCFEALKYCPYFLFLSKHVNCKVSQ